MSRSRPPSFGDLDLDGVERSRRSIRCASEERNPCDDAGQFNDGHGRGSAGRGVRVPACPGRAAPTCRGRRRAQAGPDSARGELNRRRDLVNPPASVVPASSALDEFDARTADGDRAREVTGCTEGGAEQPAGWRGVEPVDRYRCRLWMVRADSTGGAVFAKGRAYSCHGNVRRPLRADWQVPLEPGCAACDFGFPGPWSSRRRPAHGLDPSLHATMTLLVFHRPGRHCLRRERHSRSC